MAEPDAASFPLTISVPAWPEARQNAFVRDLYHWIAAWDGTGVTMPRFHASGCPLTGFVDDDHDCAAYAKAALDGWLSNNLPPETNTLS